MSKLRIVWRVYRWLAISLASILLLVVGAVKLYQTAIDPSTVPVSRAFAEQQLGIPCAGISLTGATWDKRKHIFSARYTTAPDAPADILDTALAAEGWVEQPGMPGKRRIYERHGFILQHTLPNSLLGFPAWQMERNAPANRNYSTPDDVRKFSQY